MNVQVESMVKRNLSGLTEKGYFVKLFIYGLMVMTTNMAYIVFNIFVTINCLFSFLVYDIFAPMVS